MLYTTVATGLSGYSSADVALPLLRRFYDNDGQFLPNYSPEDFKKLSVAYDAVTQMINAPEPNLLSIQTSIKALIQSIKDFSEVPRRGAVENEVSVVSQFFTSCHHYYYDNSELSESCTHKEMLKAKMLNHRLQKSDGASFSTAGLIDDAFTNVCAYILSGLQLGKIPFALQVIKGHAAFTLPEHVMFETVQSNIVKGLYQAFILKDEHAFQLFSEKLTTLYTLMAANRWEATNRLSFDHAAFIEALIKHFEVELPSINNYLADIPECVFPTEDRQAWLAQESRAAFGDTAWLLSQEHANSRADGDLALILDIVNEDSVSSNAYPTLAAALWAQAKSLWNRSQGKNIYDFDAYYLAKLAQLYLHGSDQPAHAMLREEVHRSLVNMERQIAGVAWGKFKQPTIKRLAFSNNPTHPGLDLRYLYLQTKIQHANKNMAALRLHFDNLIINAAKLPLKSDNQRDETALSHIVDEIITLLNKTEYSMLMHFSDYDAKAWNQLQKQLISSETSDKLGQQHMAGNLTHVYLALANKGIACRTETGRPLTSDPAVLFTRYRGMSEAWSHEEIAEAMDETVKNLTPVLIASSSHSSLSAAQQLAPISQVGTQLLEGQAIIDTLRQLPLEERIAFVLLHEEQIDKTSASASSSALTAGLFHAFGSTSLRKQVTAILEQTVAQLNVQQPLYDSVTTELVVTPASSSSSSSSSTAPPRGLDR